MTPKKIASHWLLVALVGAGGCGGAQHQPVVPVAKPTAVPQRPPQPPSIRITARPSYRLIVEPTESDAPARLMVLYVRLTPTSDESLRFRLSNVHVSLPDGTSAVVFDNARAVALLERLRLGVGNLAYVTDPLRRYPPGGLGPHSEKNFRALVTGRLLDETEFDGPAPLEGFLVVDMGHPLASLDGVVLEVHADRDGQSPLRGTYKFGQAPAVSDQLFVAEG